jgi:archaellum component FlaC
MTAHSKIVGLTRQLDTNTDDRLADVAPNEAEPLLASDTSSEEYAESYYYDDDVETGTRWTAFVLPSFLALAAVAWTAFFGLTYFDEARNGIAADRAVTLVSMWATPVLLLAVIWLLAMRNSRAEAVRFGDVSRLLRTESEALEARMRTVNEEISLAREFLAQNARELETVGKQSSRNMVEAAELLTTALADSDEKAKTLEAVSNAATSNLEQLRKHLPVVTSAAKDVTNQIGSAGNNAQLQIKTLIAALERVGAAGQSAREFIDTVEVRATDVSEQLENVSRQSATALDEASIAAQKRATETAELLETASKAMTSHVASASGEVDRIVSENTAKIDSNLANLRGALAVLSDQSTDEQNRISTIISEIEAHIEGSATKLSEIDRAATDQTAKLAFAVSALGESTREVGSALDNNHAITGNLIERSDALLKALSAANAEIGTTIPASMDRMNERFTAALTQMEAASANARSLNGLSDDMLAKTTSLEHLIDIQRDSVAKLMSESNANFAARHEQADALAAALSHTRTLIEEMSEDASSKLVSSLLRVRETTKQAAESSRKILDDELAHVAERLTDQNRAALAEAVDHQIATMNEVMQGAIQRNLELAEKSTAKLGVQLGQLDEMAGNLEQRIANNRESFEGIDDDSFARRMVLLTESLNSTAIDVAKILSNDVTDTAWAAYLKGDRGVFTRRAVRLLDAGEARAIATHYGDDAEFREHVNRYIHDFESMMRVLLSTRDGNAIGVTLLSSDVGKLYVALAQAIERLRN